MDRFLDATRKHPCTICGDTQRCGTSPDGVWAMCYKIADGGREKHGELGVYWTHPLSAQPIQPAPPIKNPVPSPKIASLETLYAVYTAILKFLRLIPEHREQLLARGLTPADISANRYRSLRRDDYRNLVKHMVRLFGEDILLTVPGFLIRDGPFSQYLAFCCSPGILIPVRTTTGTIVALAVRRDSAVDGKYAWATSRTKDPGPDGPGPLAICHTPRREGIADTQTIRIAEGQLKSDVASALSGILTLGIPGTASWRKALPILADLKPETVLLAFDGDARNNPNVAQDLYQAAHGLQAFVPHLYIETWSVRHKGIDDALAAQVAIHRSPWQMAMAIRYRCAPAQKKEVSRG